MNEGPLRNKNCDVLQPVEVDLVLFFSSPLSIVEYDSYGWDVLPHACHHFRHTHAPRTVANVSDRGTVRAGQLST